MSPWRSQDYKISALATGAEPIIVERATEVGRIIQKGAPGATPVFTLKHLAQLSGTSYSFLRETVERKNVEPYRLFRIKKRSLSADGTLRFRMICVPDPRLMKVQRWINAEIIAHARCHEASVAFGKDDNIVKAAAPHCACQWLIKLDIVNFFESVSERAIYHVFQSFGFQPLVAFELARLCSRKGQKSFARSGPNWEPRACRYTTITAYASDLIGHLPQGAPTSPMLANLAMKSFDEEIFNFADKRGLVYTRYADDLTISTRAQDYTREKAQEVVKEVYGQLRKYGFAPNLAKTAIIPPGSRRVVLGLLVDGIHPRLTKAFRARLHQHLYFITHKNHGPVEHAKKLGFQSVYGLRNHLQGLISYAWQIDKDFAKEAWAKLEAIEWI